jgi:hydrogenase maturation protein HypF
MKMSLLKPPVEVARLKLAVRGAVQGVGFRPFVYRLATELGLCGWINNSSQGVFLEVEGRRAAAEEFLLRLETETPPHSIIQTLEASWLAPVGHTGFEIHRSESSGPKTAIVLPDIAICPDCLREILDPENRRFRYPFTNCTHCGPRFSIVESLPYDRANTSMKSFTMCPQCQAEYDNPRDRRFHAQPNACPACGPHLELWNPAGNALFASEEALLAAARALRSGKIVAVKGLGGFHLMVAAHNHDAVQRLRERKNREEKPLAIMFPSLASVQDVCHVSSLEQQLLCSPAAPIVLLRRRQESETGHLKYQVVPGIAPGNPYLGAMLPYTPLHHLLLSQIRFPVVATSANPSDEPICIDEHEALKRLSGIADLFLVHNRPIVRHMDDSVVRVMAGREMILRRARGYAPLPIQVTNPLGNQSVLAVGGHLKNTIALAVGPQVFLSQHIGDLETPESFEAFGRVINDFQNLYDSTPAVIAMDAHPDYLSTQFARNMAHDIPNRKSVRVQHHLAHVLSCMAENELKPPVLGVSWDGTGYGLDGSVWGGEFFLVTNDSHDRVAHLRQFMLPGGDKAVKEPRRIALGLLYEIFGERVFALQGAPLNAFSPSELATLKRMLIGKLNSPLTSSVGRLFDAVAALLNLRQKIRFEGQAAMDLEFALDGVVTNERYPFEITKADQTSALVLNWEPMIKSILTDAKREVHVGEISARFHNTLAEAIVTLAKKMEQTQVALSGGCFQNRYLTERTILRLQQEGFRPFWHQRVPPNDGGIALGQVMAVFREKN